ncbi:MAG TPA: LptA/OstA family protein, partial [bacterium]|nr:LptA/OstA family protein [bacterium]
KPTTITCDGPLVIDYEKNIAHFKDHVVARDERGQLTADNMDVYYNKTSRRVSKIVAVGNVVIENPDGNKTYSDNVVYLAEEGKIILGGDAEVLYYEGNQTGLEKGIL